MSSPVSSWLLGLVRLSYPFWHMSPQSFLWLLPFGSIAFSGLLWWCHFFSVCICVFGRCCHAHDLFLLQSTVEEEEPSPSLSADLASSGFSADGDSPVTSSSCAFSTVFWDELPSSETSFIPLTPVRRQQWCTGLLLHFLDKQWVHCGRCYSDYHEFILIIVVFTLFSLNYSRYG